MENLRFEKEDAEQQLEATKSDFFGDLTKLRGKVVRSNTRTKRALKQTEELKKQLSV